MEPKNPYSILAYTILTCKVAAWLLWCLPWGVVGLALCATGILLVPGLACLSIAALPLTKTIATRNQRIVAWDQRWGYVGEEGVPWEV